MVNKILICYLPVVIWLCRDSELEPNLKAKFRQINTFPDVILNCFIIYFMLVPNSFVKTNVLYIFNLTNYFSLHIVLQLLQLYKKK